MEALMYSPQAAARTAGLCKATIYELLGRGQLVAVKHGRRTLIPAASLTGYLATLPPAEILALARDRRKAMRAAANDGRPAARGLLAEDRHSHKETAAT